MVEIVFIEILVHRDAGFVQLFVIFGAGQRRQVEKREQVDGQFAFDDLDIVNDSFACDARTAKAVADIIDDPAGLTLKNHQAVTREVLWPFY